MDLSKELRAALLELRDQRLRGISGRQKQYRVGAGTGCKHPNYQLSLPSPRPRVFAFHEQGRRTEPANREWHRANGTYPVSYGLGVVIVSIGILIAMYPIKPELSALGGFLLIFMAFTTLSFLITTPEAWVPALADANHGFPFLSGMGRLVIKDTIMLGAAFLTLTDAARESLRRRKLSA